MTSEERDGLLAAYALGSLSGPEANAVEELARSDPAAASQLAEYQEVADLIALDTPLQRADPALRARVLRAARQTERSRRRRVPIPQLLAIAALLAAVAVAVGWGVQLQGELDTLREESAALQVAVASDSRRIDVLDRELVSGTEQELRNALAQVKNTHQRSVAILADPDVSTAQLVSAQAGHGAGGRCVWSIAENAGVLIAQALPPLPLGTLYEVWLDDGVNVVSAGTFLPEAEGDAQLLIEVGVPFAPRFVIVAPTQPGEADGPQPPIVLSGDFTP
ncbi:MAG: hypothetical protein F4X76_01770 [Chloroflexi bacterium]|nr:hypothetical protein [Chloroflexota bacterium]